MITGCCCGGTAGCCTIRGCCVAGGGVVVDDVVATCKFAFVRSSYWLFIKNKKRIVIRATTPTTTAATVPPDIPDRAGNRPVSELKYSLLDVRVFTTMRCRVFSASFAILISCRSSTFYSGGTLLLS